MVFSVVSSPARWLLAALLFAGLIGCAGQADLPARVVAGGSREAFTRFRSELGAEFPAERLKEFDTAMQELQLDAMAREVATVAAREADALAAADGRTVKAVTILGWEARKRRFEREIAGVEEILAPLLRAREKAGDNLAASAQAQIASGATVLAQLRANLAATEQRLAELMQP